MKVRQTAVAFLFRGDDVLLMKKRKHWQNGKFVFSPVGGRMEPDETGHPRKACLREIFEETGIREEQISDLKMRYILLRLKGGEIRQVYVYFGKTDCKAVRESEEGELCWVNRDEWVNLDFTGILKPMIEDYAAGSSGETVVKVGVVTADEDREPRIEWSELKDLLVY